MVKILNSKPIEVKFRKVSCNRLFETVKIVDGEVYNLEYHQRRVELAFRDFFNTKPKLNLKNILKNGAKGIFRVKVVYDKDGLVSIEHFLYRKKEIKNILLIENRDFDYHFKLLNRGFFDYLHQNFDADEFLITQNGYIRDFTIGNVALKKDDIWYTPQKPLLSGTTRERLIYEQKLKKDKIHYKNLKNYSNIALLNAMVDFNILG